jgi:hypothetical protein
MDTTRYWHQNLFNSDMNDIKIKNLRSAEVTLKDILDGQLPEEVKDYCINHRAKKKDEDESDVIAPIDILFAPIVFGKPDNLIVLLWIPALMDANGVIRVKEKSFPWIPRQYLEPTDKPYIEPIGTLEDFNTYISENTLNQENWRQYFKYAIKLFEYVTRRDIGDYKAYNGHYRTPHIHVFTGLDVSQGINKNIRLLYELIAKTETSLPLYERFISPQEKPCQSLLEPIEALLYGAMGHTGQMGNSYPCSPSQRESVNHFTTLHNGEILAVNGPPGTGKTTLIQSLVASLWVNAAKLQKDPPVIAVASTNNQAVTNIIESFKKANTTGDLLDERWLPEIESYGLYLHSPTAGNPNEYPSRKKFMEKIEDKKYIQEAEVMFLSKFAEYFQCQKGLDEAIAYLHNEIEKNIFIQQEKLSMLGQFYEASKDYKTIDEFETALSKANEDIISYQHEYEKTVSLKAQWEQHLSLKPGWFILQFLPIFRGYIEKQNQHRNNYFCDQHKLQYYSEEELSLYLENQKTYLHDILEETKRLVDTIAADYQICLPWFSSNTTPEQYQGEIDTEDRYTAFKLATHYWEGRWLKEMQQFSENDLKDSATRSLGDKNLRARFRRFAKITPCFTSTLHNLGNEFSAWEGRESPLFNFIDLLIIDEAGQVLPEIAGASFSLAQKAIAMGDIYQIEPIRNLPQMIDEINFQIFGLDNKFNRKEAGEILKSLHIGSSFGSVMQVAQRACKYEKYGERGMFLSEHRRCVPEIIDYCNRLAYKGNLIPKRPSKENHPLPNMGYANIPGIAEKANSGYRNTIEAEAIVHWIKENKEKLFEMYPGKAIGDILAVITPFRAQMMTINQHLKKARLHITTGTVHAFQGSEKPIIIFSTVYDRRQPKSYFFDNNVNMLNVAVSRAQDSFLVFGDTAILDPQNPSTPSGLLAQILFQKETNEILNLTKPSKKTNEIEHINSLEGHLKALKDSINDAEKEITIVSPFISSLAIKHDNLVELFQKAINRGVKVSVYTDKWLNSYQVQPKPQFIEGVQMLEAIGVTVYVVERIHNKTICVDNRLLIEGSFNWLSTRRTPGDPWCRYEASFAYTGSEVSDMIKNLLAELEKTKEDKEL